MFGTGSSCGWSGLLSESAGKNRGSGRLSRRFCFGGADNTCSNRTGAECIGFAKGGADAETGAEHKTGTTQEAVRGTPVPTETTQKREKNLNNTGTSKVKKNSLFQKQRKKKDNKTEEKKTGCYRHTEMQRDLIIEKLKEKGLRITRQRKILLDIILEGECSCCKEIYYRASALDPKIGVATVYRMVNTLESIGAISRKNMYRVACSTKGVCTVELDDDTICHLSTEA